MNRFVSHSKDGQGNAYIHMRGVGAFQVPTNIQDGLNTATDKWLLDNVERGGFVDPFVLAEIMNRGIYWKVVEREEANRPKFSIAKFFGVE
jgi:hypothetical protein